MGLKDMRIRLRGCRALVVAAATVTLLTVGACGKRGAPEMPLVTTGVDEDGKKIKTVAPPPDNSKPFILDPLLF